jgi:hypothetical protein
VPTIAKENTSTKRSAAEILDILVIPLQPEYRGWKGTVKVLPVGFVKTLRKVVQCSFHNRSDHFNQTFAECVKHFHWKAPSMPWSGSAISPC